MTEPSLVPKDRVGRIRTLQRYPRLDLWTLWICYLLFNAINQPLSTNHVQRGLCRYDQVKDFEVVAYPGLSNWAQWYHKGVLTEVEGAEDSESEKERCRQRKGWDRRRLQVQQPWLWSWRRGHSLKDVGGSRHWKRQRGNSPLEPPEGILVSRTVRDCLCVT